MSNKSSFSLGGLKKKTSAGKGKKEYPLLPDQDGEISKSVAILCDVKLKIDQLEGIKKIHEAELKGAAREFAFKGREAPGTVKAIAENGATVSLSMQNRYYGIDATSEGSNGEEIENPRITQLKRIMGEPSFERDMDREVSVTIDLTKFDPEFRQEIVEQLVGISEMYENQGGIVAKEQYKPKESFHLNRCDYYTEEQNHEINKQLPMVVMLRAKGVK